MLSMIVNFTKGSEGIMKRLICLFCFLALLLSAALPAVAAAAPEQEVRQAIADYMDSRYKILSGLNFDEGFNGFIAPEIRGSKDVISEADVLETLVEYRKAQLNDLRFDKYKLNTEFENVKIEGDKAYAIFVDNCELYYNCAPTVRNLTTTEHVAMYSRIDGKWLLVKDDYSDADGIKKLLNDIFLKNQAGKDEIKKMALELLENQMDARLAKLDELVGDTGDKGLSVFYAGKNIACIGGRTGKIDNNSSVVPLVINGTNLLPVRFTAENLGAQVSWDNKTSTVKIIFKGHEITLKAGAREVLADGAVIPLSVPVKVQNGRTMLQADILARVLVKKLLENKKGLTVLYDQEMESTAASALSEKLEGFFDVLYTKANFPRIDGSTATYPLSMEIGKELLGLDDTGVKGFITHKTTHNAYVNLINGAADIIFVTQPSPEEYELAKQKGVELEVLPICKEGFVFLVNTENPVNNLAIKQVQDIYRGLVKNWKEAGGEDKEIIPYQREANSGSQTIMENTVMKGLKMVQPPKEVLVYGMGELIDRVADYSNAKNALGYSVYYYATTMYKSRNIKLLSIDGIQPDKQTIRDGTYPFTVSYYAVLRKNEPEDSSARRLLKWLLGEEGQTIVDRAGLVSLN